MTLWSVVVRTLTIFEPRPGEGRRFAAGACASVMTAMSVVSGGDRGAQLVRGVRRVLLQVADVGLVHVLRDDAHDEVHRGVLLAAELRAAPGVGAGAGGRELEGVEA